MGSDLEGNPLNVSLHNRRGGWAVLLSNPVHVGHPALVNRLMNDSFGIGVLIVTYVLNVEYNALYCIRRSFLHTACLCPQ